MDRRTIDVKAAPVHLLEALAKSLAAQIDAGEQGARELLEIVIIQIQRKGIST